MFKTTFYNQGNLFGTKMQKLSTYLFIPLLTGRPADRYYLTFYLHFLRYEMATIIQLVFMMATNCPQQYK